MSEKRFQKGENLSCVDTETRKYYWYACNLCGLLNELAEENEKLRQQLNGKDCRKCGNYCRDKALDYCLVDEREPSYFSFPFKWDYKAEAEKCKYYYR